MGVAQLPTTACHRVSNNNHTLNSSVNASSNNSSAMSLFYSWFVDRVVNGSYRESVNDVIMNNRDPRRLVIPPYILLPGEQYVVTMMVQVMNDDKFIELSAVNCSVEVIVNSGRVIALLNGGDRRQVAVGSQLTIDAGSSYDEDYSHFNGWLMGFQWSCEMTFLTGIADVTTTSWSKCPFALNTSTTLPSLLAVPSNTLSAGSTYVFYVTAISADGSRRSDPAAASVHATAVTVSEQQTSCLIKTTSNGVRSNTDQQLVLPGEVFFGDSSSSSSSHQGLVKAVWSVIDGGVSENWSSSALTRATLTPLEKTMMPTQLSATTRQQSFPLALSPWAFGKTVAQGKIFTFRLTAQPLLTTSPSSPSSSVFTEVVVSVNCPPTGGFMMVSPDRGGLALSTLFTLASVGWTDDVDDMPLRYSFQYQLSPLLPLLDIAGPSTTATISSMLPAGLNTNNGSSLAALMVVGRVADAFNAMVNASVEVMVEEPTAIGPTTNTFLVTGLQAGLAASNADQILSTVNLVASMLYRHHASANVSSINVTTLVSKCSGHGMYGFVDVAGNPMTSTTTGSDTLGGASGSPTTFKSSPSSGVCVCSDGYGGMDCSLNAPELAVRAAMRQDMCSALLELTWIQDRSEFLFDALLRSLSMSFDPYEVRSDDGRVACSYVLRFLANVLREEELPRLSAESYVLFAQVVSSFLEVYRYPQAGLLSGIDGGSSVFESNVRAALGALTSSLRKRIILGMSPMIVAAGNLRAVVSYGLSPSMQQRSDGGIARANHSNHIMVEMHTVASSPHSAGIYPSFAKTATRLTVDSNQLGSICGINADDALTTVLQVRADMRKRVNQTSSFASTREKKVSPSYQLSITNAAVSSLETQTQKQGSADMLVPAYYITMPFVASQELFNHTARRRYDDDQAALSPLSDKNVSSVLAQALPQCATFDGEKYVPCRHCNISSLTSVNVTFACYDVSQLCQAISGDGSSSSEVNLRREGSEEGGFAEPYLSSIFVDHPLGSRALAPKGGKKGGGGGKK